MEDRDEKKGSDPEIEAHRRKVLKASDEGPKDEDVEAHKRKIKASDDPGSEPDDDVELHTTTTTTTT